MAARIIKRQIHAEIASGAERYTLIGEYRVGNKISFAIIRRVREAIGDKRNYALWRQYETKYRWNYDKLKWTGYQRFFQLGVQLIRDSRCRFAACNHTGDWSEAVVGDQFQDSVNSWRERAKNLLVQTVGNWEAQS